MPFSLSLNRPLFRQLAHDSRATAFEKDSKTAIFSNVQMMGAVTVV
jgi:hypothetical protein